MSLQLNLNLEFLEKLQPPTNFPPAEEEVTAQLESRFLAECDRFISNERALYRCSKAVEARLNRILTSSQDIEHTLTSQRDKMDFIAHQLTKYKDQEATLKERERVLRMLCELVRMEDLRKDLLVGQRQPLEQDSKPLVVDESQYLLKLQRLTQIIRDSQALAALRDFFPLLKEIVVQLQSIASAANKLIAKRLLTPRMVELAVGEFYQLFSNGGEVLPAVVAHRLQNLRVSLNPQVNSLNYVANTAELFESIFVCWSDLLSRELVFFQPCGRFDLVRSINSQLMAQLLPRIEKSVFKVKDLVGLVRIRKAYSEFQRILEGVKEWGQRRENQWDAISSAVNKCEALIGARLAEEAEFLESSKYNIHTMASYIPIREHLQKVRMCYQLSIIGEKLDWQVGFYSLCTSRDPKNYPNNKSLLIFNLNIWYLYLKLLPNGIHRDQGQQLIKWCSNTFTNINIQETKKKFYDSFQKVLELCGNLPAFKAVLYAEIHLLGHQDLRREISKAIREKYVEVYQQTLTKIQQAPMTHQEVKAFCQARKINLNKFGKHSHTLCVHSPAALAELLEQP